MSKIQLSPCGLCVQSMTKMLNANEHFRLVSQSRMMSRPPSYKTLIQPWQPHHRHQDCLLSLANRILPKEQLFHLTRQCEYEDLSHTDHVLSGDGGRGLVEGGPIFVSTLPLHLWPGASLLIPFLLPGLKRHPPHRPRLLKQEVTTNENILNYCATHLNLKALKVNNGMKITQSLTK